MVKNSLFSPVKQFVFQGYPPTEIQEQVFCASRICRPVSTAHPGELPVCDIEKAQDEEGGQQVDEPVHFTL
jgi:hypothetical protein